MSPQELEILKANQEKLNMLQPAVVRYIHHDDSKYNEIRFEANPKKDTLMNKFCFFLINQIEEPEYRKIFSASIPAIKQSVDVRNILLPYLVYFALRFNNIGGASGVVGSCINDETQINYAAIRSPE